MGFDFILGKPAPQCSGLVHGCGPLAGNAGLGIPMLEVWKREEIMVKKRWDKRAPSVVQISVTLTEDSLTKKLLMKFLVQGQMGNRRSNGELEVYL